MSSGNERKPLRLSGRDLDFLVDVVSPEVSDKAQLKQIIHLISIFLRPVIRIIAIDDLEFVPLRGILDRQGTVIMVFQDIVAPAVSPGVVIHGQPFLVSGFRVECFYLLGDNLIELFLDITPGLAPVAVDFTAYALHLPDDLTVLLPAALLGVGGTPYP